MWWLRRETTNTAATATATAKETQGKNPQLNVWPCISGKDAVYVIPFHLLYFKK